MPKNRKVVKVGDTKKVVRDSSKLRIGTRKNGTNANLMSNQKLFDVVNGSTNKRYRNNAIAVLYKRGAV